jgi:hypothetical protein
MDMRNLFRTVVAALAATTLAVAPALAELPFTGYRAIGPVAGTSSTASVDNVAFYVKYVGTASTKPTVEVAANGDITFKVAGVADATVGCPTVGTGIIDVSDTACNTYVEVADSINATAAWRAVIVDALGTDSSNDSIATLSATDTNIRTTGVPLFYDTNFAGSAPTVTVMLRPPGGTGSFFWEGLTLNPNPFASFTSFLSAVSEKKTSGGTIASTVIFGVKRVYTGTSRKLSETIRTVWSQTGAATATQGTLDVSAFPFVSAQGEVFIARIGSSTTISVQNLNAVGVLTSPQQP